MTGDAGRRAAVAKVLRFGCVGGTGFLADAGLLALLVGAGLHPLPARLCSIAVALYMTWRLNRSITFRTTAPASAREFARYAGVGAASSAVNFGVYAALLATGLATSPLLATAIGSAVAMAFTFWGLDAWVFARADLRPGARPQGPRSTPR